LLGCTVVSYLPGCDAKHKYPCINPCTCISVGWIVLSVASLSCTVSNPSHTSIPQRCPLLCNGLLKHVSGASDTHTTVGPHQCYTMSVEDRSHQEQKYWEESQLLEAITKQWVHEDTADWKDLGIAVQWNLYSSFLSGVWKRNNRSGKTIDAGAIVEIGFAQGP
jgi:hypothetical protein